MAGDLRCFNCGSPTDFVGDDGEAICRDCHNARKGAVEVEEPKPKRATGTTRQRGQRGKAR